MDEWDRRQAETVVGECRQCHQRRAVQLCVDPWRDQGIYLDWLAEKEYWCLPCFEKRCDDI